MLTHAQVIQLLQPINPVRVLKDGKNNSHVAQQDVVAHLIRVFGFGNFSTEIISTELVFESQRFDAQGKPLHNKWDVCYRAAMRLTIHGPGEGKYGIRDNIAIYEDVSCGDAQNQSRWDAHDLALKSAISTAKKRCAIHLGDQFGLSLYNKGQMTALVRGTMVMPPEEGAPVKDMQEGVERQVSLGTDEIEKQAEPDAEQVKVLENSLGAVVVETTEAE